MPRATTENGIAEPGRGLPAEPREDIEVNFAEGSAPITPPEPPSLTVARRMRQSLSPEQPDDDFAAAIEQFGDVLVGKLKAAGGGGGDDGDGPGDSSLRLQAITKAAKRGNWNTVIATLFTMIAAAITGYYGIKYQARQNAKAIKDHAAMDGHPAMVERAAKIETTVKQVKTDISGPDGKGGLKAQQQKVIEGIEQLKREAQTEKQKRLEAQVDELERRLREERRRRRR